MLAKDIELLFDYSYAATRQMLNAAQRLTDAKFIAEPPLTGACSLQHILVHMLDTEIGWRENLRAGRRNASPELVLAAFPNVATLDEAWRADEQTMRAWLATLDDDAINAPSYNPAIQVWKCLVHVVNHSTQHRSEAAMILTHFGQSPGDLDFTFYFRGFRDDGSVRSSRHDLRTVLQRLGQMMRADRLLPGQVGDCSRQLEDAVVRARRELELAHRRAHQRLTGVVEIAVNLHLFGAHVGVRP